MYQSCVSVNMEYLPTKINNTYMADSSELNLSVNSRNISSLQSAILSFSKSYTSVFGYIALGICCYSVIANIFNVIILTRKEMKTPANAFLLGIALTDGLKVTLYIPWVLQAYILYGTAISSERNTEAYARYLHFWAVSSIIIHSISVWLTVTLAIYRYTCITSHWINAKCGNIKTARIIIVTVSVFAMTISSPMLVMYRVGQIPTKKLNLGTFNTSLWTLDMTKDHMLLKVNFWIQALVIRFIPCILLMIFTILLIKTLKDAKVKRKAMTVNTTFSNRTERTTKMLLAIVILFLLTETPHGILILLCGIIKNFFKDYYIPLADLIDTLALLNDGITFVLYCAMSRVFRRKLIALFWRCCCIRE